MPGRVYPATVTVTKNLFTGKERDSETNWDYFGARYYHPAIGRWLAVDPLTEQYPSLSPYSYAANNPVVVYDPDGRYLETLIDLASLGVSIYDVARDPSSASNWIGLGLDVVSVLAPGAAALGTIYKAADRGVEATKAIEKVSDTASDLQKAAQTAAEKVGPGKGGAHGTKVHTEFKREVKEIRPDLGTEVTYKGGRVAEYGEKGSIRVDVVEGPIKAPTVVYDLKTGEAKLTPKRERQIREHLPPKSKDIPIKEIREKNQ